MLKTYALEVHILTSPKPKKKKMNIPINIDYSEYFPNLLGLVVTLLGLLIAASTFILQNGFTSFKFNRNMFLKHYSNLSKLLFYGFGYMIYISLTQMYFPNYSKILLIIHLVFSLIFLKSILDLYSHKGYIKTLFSNRFNPYRSKFRKYFRYIRNNGLIPNLVLLIAIFLIVVYPIWIAKIETGCYWLTEKAVFLSTVSLFIYSVYYLVSIIPEFYGYSIQELETIVESENDNDNKSEIDFDYKRELDTLKVALVKNNYQELNPLTPKSFLDGELISNLRMGNYPEAFFIINITVQDSDVFEIRNAVEEYAYDLYKGIASIPIDINSFALSIFVKVNGDKDRHLFMRLKRTELRDLLSTKFTANDFITGIENKLFDELYRDI